MATLLTPDLCVIGAGSAGLSVAAGAEQMGAHTVLIESGAMGGDCLNTGCVPSKALLAAAARAQAMTGGAPFGIAAARPEVDFAKVQAHVRAVIDAIAPVDSRERFEGLGVTLLRTRARFIDPRTVAAGEVSVRPRRFVVATGSRPVIPPIPGLKDVPYLTNETLFENKTLPEHLIVIGGGPIGMEMAQAHRRLGARVTVLDMGSILPRDDLQLVGVLRDCLVKEGVDIREHVRLTQVRKTETGVEVTFRRDEQTATLAGSHLLVAAGRTADVEDLGLDHANVAYSARGIVVDDRLRSVTNGRVFAIGDVAGALQFTHVAGYHAGIVLRNALFRIPAKADLSACPWVTYCDPELAHVGLHEEPARRKYGHKVRVLIWPLKDNDWAQADRQVQGLIKAVVLVNGKILGASILAPHAGEMIQMWTLAMHTGMKIGALATYIAPYPTYGEITKRAAGSFYAPTLFSKRTKLLVKLLSLLG